MKWMWKHWKRLVAIMGGIISLLAAFFIYLSFTQPEDRFPHISSPSISMDFPSEGYRFSGDFTVRLSGNLAKSDQLWIAAMDANHRWYPLAQAVPANEGRWSAVIHNGQIIVPVSLCALKADGNAAESFHNFLRSNKFASGLAGLPAGSEPMRCVNVQPG